MVCAAHDMLTRTTSLRRNHRFLFGEQFHYATTAILILSFVKIRFVFLDFMELRTAPWPLRMAFEAWAVSVCVTLIGLYWFGV